MPTFPADFDPPPRPFRRGSESPELELKEPKDPKDPKPKDPKILEPKGESDPESELGLEPVPVPAPVPVPKPVPVPELELGPDPELGLKPELEPNPDPDPDSGPEDDPDSGPKPWPEPDLRLWPAGLDSESEPEVGPEASGPSLVSDPGPLSGRPVKGLRSISHRASRIPRLVVDLPAIRIRISYNR